MDCLGIDIGLISVKATFLSDGQERWTEIVDHEGNIPQTLLDLLQRRGVNGQVRAVTTGNAGRHQVRTEKVIPPQAIEAGLRAIGEHPDAVVSLGGESIVVYTMTPSGLTREAMAGDKCAAGTGEFFRQQLARMDLTLDVLERIPDGTCMHSLSSRCSVFMKSDCTHKLNKREATKEEIVVSLAEVMAGKVMEFLTRARTTTGRVLLIGGVTRNRFLRASLQRQLPGLSFVTPPQATYFEAFGAAHLAASLGRPLPPGDDLFDVGTVTFERCPPLTDTAELVLVLPSSRGPLLPGRRYVMGIDGGSTTTKAVLVDAETRQICAAHYGRTHGDPVQALRRVLAEIRAQVQEQAGGADAICIPLAATTGSSREVLGMFVETKGIYNEIIAHTVGTTHFRSGIDTLFEIGGQDAKYVYVRSGVPIDYAMNEACSAGTGSFLEETAQSDLSIRTAPEIGPIALQSRAPLRFGEHCSAFINSDIRKAIQEGAGKPDIMAGIVLSIVSNYLNRVVGNRTVGESIVLQGGVAKNPAVPMAFAAVLRKPILVPPDPELLGAFGVALLALQRQEQGELQVSSFSLDELVARPMERGKIFSCKSCENRCPVQTLMVGQSRTRYFFGGRCNKYALARRRRETDRPEQAEDLVQVREQLLFGDCAPDPAALRPRTDAVVGVPRAFTVHSLWPLYAHFFFELGVRTVLSQRSLREGVQRVESAYCLPGEIAHGMTEELLRAGVDYLFLPHLVQMESMEPDVWATLCPLTQGMPYYLRPAFDLSDERILRPVLSFGEGLAKGGEPFGEMAVRLGFSREQGMRAFDVAAGRQQEFFRRCREIGTGILDRIGRGDEVAVVLFGRPYNAFAPEANMGVPRKLITRGRTVVPFDLLPLGAEQIPQNMYWYYGQQNLKAARLVKQQRNLFACYISNFGCAPDSFMLHLLRWIMGTKPYLVLEMDSHTADAGVDTRVEAFLDIIRGYRTKAGEIHDRPHRQRYRVALKGANTHIKDSRTGERLPLRHERVRLIWPSMGELSTQAMRAISSQLGVRSDYLPAADIQTTQLARAVASGKECIPTLLVLGQILKLLRDRPPPAEEVLAVIVPRTTGPCRTGQYGPFFEHTFSDLDIQNVAIMGLSSDNGYTELGPDFSRLAWMGLVLGDHFRDMELALEMLAADPGEARRVFGEVWRGVLQVLGSDIREIYPFLETEAAPRLASLPLRQELTSLKKAIVVGEIYVRRDDFSTKELLQHLIANRIYPKITGITEWIYYCDHSRELQLAERLRRLPWYRRPLKRGFGEWLGLRVEQAFMRAVDWRVRQVLEVTGLLPHSPHDMRQIMADVDTFTSLAFETEATVSSLTAALAVRQGYDGIIAIAPFACLPGRLIKAMLEPYTRARGIPFISIESDGLRFPPNVVSRLEIFMLNVLRRQAAGPGNGARAEAALGTYGARGVQEHTVRPAPADCPVMADIRSR